MKIYIDMYLDYLNDFLSVQFFANYYGLHEKRAKRSLNKGRVLYNDRFGHH